MAATASEFVKKAASQIGVKESPAGSNKVKYAEWYGMNGQPWCAMFVSWVADQVGALSLTGKFAYCPSWVNYAKKLGQWLDREEKPKAGDIVFFSNGTRACHVGIVEKRNGTSSVTTIEGNTSTSSNDNGGAVMRRTRSYGTVGSSWYILGFFRPKWGSSSSGSSSSSSSSTTGKAAIKKVQAWVGTTQDGIDGPNTKKATIKKYQTELNKQYKAGLTVDGIWGSKTKAASVNVKKGAKGNITKCLQARLICLGYDTGGFDGELGSKTESAVKSFQKKKGLTVDGIAGKNTWAKLFG